MKTVITTFFLVLHFTFNSTYIFGQSRIWEHAFFDTEFTTFAGMGSGSISYGGKINKYLGIGLRNEKLSRGQDIVGIHFRGTTLSPKEKWGFYYSSTLGIYFDQGKKGFHYELVGGYRFRQIGLALGYRSDGVAIKFSQLFGDVQKERRTGKKPIFRDETTIVPKSKEDRSKSPMKEQEVFGHFSIGLGSSNISSNIMKLDYSPIGFNFNGILGITLKRNLGLGVGLYSVGMVGDGRAYNMTAWGASINWVPKFFMFNLLVGGVTRYDLIEHLEFTESEFHKAKRAALFLDFKFGLKISKRLTLGISKFRTAKISGNYIQYEDRISYPRVVEIEETRKGKIRRGQFFIGFSF